MTKYGNNRGRNRMTPEPAKDSELARSLQWSGFSVNKNGALLKRASPSVGALAKEGAVFNVVEPSDSFNVKVRPAAVKVDQIARLCWHYEERQQ